ncbi:Major facilitator superfamily [Elusimicrobium minutum Pei191]|uniref:Major facilitator superfamily n=1 Tax=Elusimicrobium minutum (strain Pei191) TaxID=445932 RepID=B2KD41_ELUMP|nr:MFS transporter [Elusimicrobium minutum]ACC98437.1 Major facilitator superfamily [Elusimicrobium minutum Pei191]
MSAAKFLSKNKLLILAISVASFMVNLDTYIINVSLPSIAGGFNASTADISWVAMAYNLTVVSLLLIFGKLGDKVGLKFLFITGFIIFTLSSILCGFAPSLPFLVAGRLLQGIGASILYALPQAMIPKYLPKEERGMAFGILASAAALGITLGAPLSGIITGLYSWRWIFFINLPVGILAVIVLNYSIPSKNTITKREPHFDIPGAVLSFLMALAFTFWINRGGIYGWTAPKMLLCLAFAVITFGIFIKREKKAKYPLLDLSLFNNITFNFANIAMFLVSAFLAGTNFLMPFYLAEIKGLSPARTGAAFMVYSVSYMLTGLVSGKLSAKIPAGKLCAWSMLLASVTLAGLVYMLNTSGIYYIILYFTLTGVSFAFFITSNNNFVMSMAPENKEGMVSGAHRMVGRMGMLCGVALFEAVFSFYGSENLINGFRGAYALGAAMCFAAMLFSLKKPVLKLNKGDVI